MNTSISRKINKLTIKLITTTSIIFLGFLGAMGQNAIVGTGFSTGWDNGSCNDNSNFKYLSSSVGGSWILTTTASGTGDRFFRMGIDWGGARYSVSGNGAAGVNNAVVPNTTYILNNLCDNSGTMFYNVSNAAWNYVFKTRSAGNPPAPPSQMVFFEIQGAVQTVTSVTQSPLATGIAAGTPVTVTATLSGAFNAGQAAYLRYTTNSWGSSTVVPMTGTGTTRTGTIPGLVGSTNVQYYVFTSGTANVANDGSNADFYTINLNNNSGSNYSYSVSSNPVSVVSTGGSTPNTTYATLAAAISAINGGTAHTGTITCTVNGGHTETAPAGGYVITATGTVTNPIVFQKGAGANPVFTAFTPQTSGLRADAVIKIVGGDYITIDGFSIRENASNLTTTVVSNNMTEFGIALFLTTATNGAQNNTIQNCNIQLGSTYQNTFGIFSTSSFSSTNTALAATSTAGTNSNNIFRANTISNVAYGIGFICEPVTSTINEGGNIVGGATAADGNNITFGISTAADAGWSRFGAGIAGIYYRNGAGFTARNNTITGNSITLAHFGINISSGSVPSGVTYTANLSNNTITVTNSGITDATGIDFGHGMANATFTGSNNTVNVNQTTSTASAAGNLRGIRASYTSGGGTLNNNSITINQTYTPSTTTANTTIITALALPGGSTTITSTGNTILINRSSSPSAGTATLSGAVNGIAANVFAATTIQIGNTGSGNGNTITIREATGGAGTTTYSSAVTYVDLGTVAHGTINVVNNTFNTTLSAIRSTGALNVVNQSGTATITTLVNVKSNTATIDRVAASGAVGFFTQTSTTPNDPADTLSSNTITFTSLAGSSSVIAIQKSGGSATAVKNICNNTISITGTNTGNVTGISYNFNASALVKGNSITVNTASPSIIGITNGSSATASSINTNTFSLTSSTTSPTSMVAIQSAGIGAHQIFNNTFSALNFTGSITGSPTISAISSAAGTGAAIYNNVITNISVGSAGAATPVVDGILISGSTSTNVYQNKIFGITCGATGSTTVVDGIRVSGGSCAIYNNLIGGLSATAASGTDLVRGINITSTSATTNINVFHNTIYLSGTSSGTNFGGTGIFHTTSTTATTAQLNLRNNIIYNDITPKGTGLAVAFRRSSGAANALANYASTSNNNLFFAGIPGANNLIYSDGTSSAQTIAAYRSGLFTAGTIAPRDAASISEAITFVSTTGSSTDFLKYPTGTALQVEQGGVTGTGITDDYAGTTRCPGGGCPGSASAPDIGAWELNGTPSDVIPPVITYTALTNTCNTGDLTLSGVTITDASGVPTSGGLMPRVYFRKNAGTWFSNAGTLTSGSATNGTWSFDILAASMGGLTGGDAVQYYVIAQDVAPTNNISSNPVTGLVATNVNTVTTSPTTPNSVSIIYTLNGTYSVGSAQPAPFNTLTNAINLYNTACISGPVVYSLTDATYSGSEIFPISINSNSYQSSTNTFTIRPAAGVAATITGATTAGSPLIDLNGADYVTFDGINTGGSSLTISNTTASSTAGTSTIQFVNGATNNLVTNATVLGSSFTGFTSLGGTITFSTDGSTPNGNDANTISYCNIGPAGSNLPSKAIFGLGSTSTAAIGNSGIVIDNNNIYDYFLNNNPSAGVYTNAGCNTWSITNNKFYQTATRTWISGAQHSAIWLLPTTPTTGMQGATITGNTIGFAASNGTGTYTLTGNAGKFVGIYYSGITGGTVSNINNNTIAGVSLTGVTSLGTGNGSPFAAIIINSGLANSNSNIIGSQSATGSLVFTTNTTSATDVYGIYNLSSDDWTSNNNQIGGITATNTGASGAFIVYGLRNNTATAKTWTANTNLIGGTVANSIQNVSPSTTSILYGMFNDLGIMSVSGNTVRNLNATAASVSGIVNLSTAATTNISNNSVFTLSAATAAGFVRGIHINIGTTVNVNKNRIFDLSSNGTTSLVSGIQVSAGTTVNITNNRIADLRSPNGSNTTTEVIRGINLTSTATSSSINVYYNTVVLSASAGGTNFSTSAMFHTHSGTATTAALRMNNNIFVNNSINNGTGLAAAFRQSTSSTTFNNFVSTSNNNLFFVGTPSATRGIYIGGTTVAQTLANYKALSGLTPRDQASVTENPTFLSTVGSNANFLKINTAVASQAESGAVNISGLTDDFENDVRQGNPGYTAQANGGGTAPDIGADEFDGTPSDITPPTITLTSVPSAGCSTPSFTATITDASGVDVNPGTRPRVYYKISTTADVLASSNTSGAVTDGWKFSESTTGSSPFTFNIDLSLLNTPLVNGNILQYFVVAQDLAAVPNVAINGTTTFANAQTSPALAANAFPLGGGAVQSITALVALSGTVTVGTAGTYATFNGASGLFSALNTAGLSGNLTVNVISNITETAQTPLNAITSCAGGPYSITIQADGTTQRVISPSTSSISTTALIEFNGADNITIDGSFGTPTGQYLSFRNTNGSGGAVFLLDNDVDNVTIKNCDIQGYTSTTTSGVVFLGAGTSAGNTNITIDKCNIHSSQSSYPLQLIYSNGNNAARNSNVTISNNNLYEFSSFGGGSGGRRAYAINVTGTGNGSNWNITGNSIYNPFIDGTGFQSAINFIPGSTSTTNSISNNWIGGQAPLGGAANTPWQNSYNPSNTENRGEGIVVNAGNATIDGNNITNIWWSGSDYTGFMGVNVVGSTVATITNNNFGSGTAGTPDNTKIIRVSGGGISFGSNGGYIYGIWNQSTTSSSTSYSGNNFYTLWQSGAYSGGFVQCIFHQTAGPASITSNAINGPQAVGYGFFSFGIRLEPTASTSGNLIAGNIIAGPFINGYDVLSYGSANFGILVKASSTYTVSGTIERNVIWDMRNQDYGGISQGILVYSTSGGNGNWNIRNNQITLKNNGSTANCVNLIGIEVDLNSASTTDVSYNTVYISGSNGGSTFAGNDFSSYGYLRYPGVSGTVVGDALTLNNNIFINTRLASTASVLGHFAIANVGSSNFATNFNTSNYNFLATGNGSKSFVGRWGGATQLALSNWQSASSKDANSYTATYTAGASNFSGSTLNPDNLFVNPLSDVHISVLDGQSYQFVSDRGTPVGVTIDYDGVTRDATNPDIGADEFTVPPLDAGVTAYTSTSFCPGSQSVQAIVTNFGTSTLTSFDVTWSVNGVSQGTVNITGQNIAQGATATVTLGNFNFLAATNYTITASTSNPNGGVDGNAGNNSFTSASFQTQLTGTYTVGVGQNFTTLTAAVAAANLYGLCGPTIFNLTDATYSGSETFPITINALAGASATNNLTIKPASGVTTSISGSNSSAILRLNGADYIILDGSNNGTTSRNLSITNTNSGASSAVIWLNSVLSPLDGATNNTIKNIIVTGNAPTTTLAGILTSSSTIGNNADAANSANTIQNNLVTTSYYGIGLAGVAGNDVGNSIIGNTIGSTVAGSKIGLQGIYLSNQQNVSISNNTVLGVNSSTNIITAGIYVEGTISGGSISGNVIRDVKNTTAAGRQAFGLQLNSSSSASNLTVSNNMIFDVANSANNATLSRGAHGIAIMTGGGYNLYFNTVSMSSNPTAANVFGVNAALYVASGVTGLDIENNIFDNSQTALLNRYAIYSDASASAFATINYNSYSSTGTNLGYLTSNRTTLANIVTGFGGNANSVAVDPVFVSSTTDMHLDPALNNSLNNVGLTISGVTTDIDGDVRCPGVGCPGSGSAPDIGADEFQPSIPPCVTVYSPVTGSTVPLNSAISWTAPAGSPTGYDVYFDQNNPPTTLVSNNQPGTSYTPSGMTGGQTYYLMAIARNASGPAVSCTPATYNTAANMSYTSSNTVQLNNGSVFAPSSANNQILQLQVVTTGSNNPFDVTSLVFATTGSTNPTTDFVNAKVYYTGSTNTFSTATQFGTTTLNPNGTFTVNGTQTLAAGINYFWLTYDIGATPTILNNVDACCTSIVMSGAGGTQTPSTTCPAGNATINVTYCTNLYGAGGCSASDFIDNIAIANLNQTGTGCTGGTGIADFTGTTVNFNQGVTYPFTITTGSTLENIGWWIDFNDNGSFGDAGEFLGNTFSSSLTITGNVAIPTGAALGNHRMRVRMVYGSGNPQSLATSCTLYANGETHDYTANISAAPACSTPTYASYPFSENFESWPSCLYTNEDPGINWTASPLFGNNAWRRNDQGSTAVWTSTLGAYSPVSTLGSFSARFNSYNTASQGNIDLYIDCSSGPSTKELTFDYNNTSGSDVLAILISTNGPAGPFTQLGSNLGIRSSSGWTKQYINFTSTSATTVIRFRATGDNGTTDIGIDNLTIGDPCSVTYASYPFTESFENWTNCTGTSNVPGINWTTSQIPSFGSNCWRRNDQGSTAVWTSTSGAYSPASTMGSFSARFNSYNTASQGNIDLYIDCSSGPSTKELTFDYNNTSGSDVLAILISTNGPAGPFTQLGSNLGIRSSSGWTKQYINFTSTSATTVIRFRATGDNGTTDIGIDNLTIGDPCSVTYASYPFTESFENWINCTGTSNVPGINWTTSQIPSFGSNCWRRNDQGSTAVWTSVSGAYSPVSTLGSFSARFNSFNTNSQGNIDLYIDCSSGPSLKEIAFDYINTSGSDVLAVLVSTTGPGGTFTQVGSNFGTATATSWTRQYVNFTSTSATTVIRFRATGDNGTTDIGMDNLTIGAACLPTYASLPFGGESFESWTNCSGNSNVPSNNWTSSPLPSFGNNVWRRNDEGVTRGYWSNLSGAYSPLFSVGSRSARFHSYNTTGTGILDFYIDLSSTAASKNITFDYINTSGSDVLGVYVSTNGAAGPFTQIGSNLTTASTWTGQSFTTTSNSATTVIRLQATGDNGFTDIGLDNFNVVANAPLAITSITGVQQTGNVAQNSTNNNMLRVDLVATGSTGTLTLNTLNVTGSNTNNADVTGITLWTGTISGPTAQIGTTATFSGGVATFSGLSTGITAGTTYLWVRYNVSASAIPGNLTDAKIVIGDITIAAAGGATAPGSQPVADVDPTGSRPIVGALCGTTYTINNLSPTAGLNYNSFTDAVNDLNLRGVSCAVVFNVKDGQTFNELVPAITATGTVANTITFQRDNSTGTRPSLVGTTGVGTLDAVLQLNGSDYIIWDGINLSDNAANSTATTRMEYGVYMRGSAADGCKNNIIRNTNISLTRSYASTRCVWVSSAATSVAGTNSDNKFLNIAASNSTWGYNFDGVSAFPDNNNEINTTGGGISTINSMGVNTNTATYGVIISNETNFKLYNTSMTDYTATSGGDIFVFNSSAGSANTMDIQNNTISGITLTGSTSARVRGISITSGTSATVSNNIIRNITTEGYLFGIYSNQGTLTATSNTIGSAGNPLTCTGVATELVGIFASSGSSSPSITNNTISNLVVSSGVSTYFEGIDVNTPNATITGNTIQNCTTNGTSTTLSSSGIYLGSNASSNINCSNNTITGLTASSSGYMIAIESDGAGVTINNNNINTISNTGSGWIWAVSFNGLSSVASNNTVSGLTTNTGNCSGIVAGSSASGAAIRSNTVRNLTVGGGSTTVSGAIAVFGTGTNTIEKNIIDNINNNATTGALSLGIRASGSSTATYIVNNMISRITANNSNNGAACAVRGITLESGTTARVYNNTVYLSGTATNAAFESGALYSTTSATLDSRNNILYNAYGGTGKQSAIYFTSSDATYQTNLNAASNNNLLFAGTPGSNNVILRVNSGGDKQTLTNYTALTTGKETNSFSPTIAIPFINITTSPNDLHIDVTSANLCEFHNKGVAITSPLAVTDDIDAGVRGSVPDVGADEWNMPTLTAATIISPSALCGTNSVTLSGTGASTGTEVFSQWQVSTTGSGGTFSNITNGGIYSGATTTSLSISNVSGLNGFAYRLVTSRCNPVAATSSNSNIVTLTVTSNCAFVWTGDINTDWNIAGNWSSGSVPTTTTDVIIPDVANDPIVGAYTANCANFTIQSGATFGFSGGVASSILIINGASPVITTSNNIFSGAGVLQIGTGSATATITGGATFNNSRVTISANSSLTLLGSSIFNIGRSIRVNSGAVVNSFGSNSASTYLNFVDDGINTGLIDYNGGTANGLVLGQVKAERKVFGSMGYRYLASPVQGNLSQWSDDFSIVGADGFAHTGTATTTPWPNVWRYDETNPAPSSGMGWVSNTNGSYPYDRATGYACIISATDIDVTGPLWVDAGNSGTLTKAVTNTASGTATADGWNLVGNPFAAPLNFAALYSDNGSSTINSSRIIATSYTFKATSTYQGNYATYNALTSVSVNGGVQNIAAHQGFYVKATSSGNLTFKSSYAASNPAYTFLKQIPETSISRLRLSLYAQNELVDECVLALHESATDRQDDHYDSEKLFARNGTPEIYLTQENNTSRALALSTLPNIETKSIVPIGLTQNGIFNVRISEFENWTEHSNIFLFDKRLNKHYLLSKNDLVSLSKSDFESETGRYFLKFETPEDYSVFNTNENQGFVYLESSILYASLNFKEPTAAELEIFDVSGRIVFKASNLNPNGISNFDLTALNTGIYTVRISTNNMVLNNRIILNH